MLRYPVAPDDRKALAPKLMTLHTPQSCRSADWLHPGTTCNTGVSGGPNENNNLELTFPLRQTCSESWTLYARRTSQSAERTGPSEEGPATQADPRPEMSFSWFYQHSWKESRITLHGLKYSLHLTDRHRYRFYALPYGAASIPRRYTTPRLTEFWVPHSANRNAEWKDLTRRDEQMLSSFRRAAWQLQRALGLDIHSPMVECWPQKAESLITDESLCTPYLDGSQDEDVGIEVPWLYRAAEKGGKVYSKMSNPVKFFRLENSKLSHLETWALLFNICCLFFANEVIKWNIFGRTFRLCRHLRRAKNGSRH